MKQLIVLTTLIFSGLALNAQNLTNTQVVAVNWTNNNSNGSTQQMATHYNYSNDINPSYQQSLNINTLDNVEIQSNNRGRGSSSALQSFGNNNINGNKSNIPVQQKTTANKPVVKRNVNNVINDDVASANKGNNFETNENVLDNNVGNQGAVQLRGNVINDINSNPVVNDTKKTTNSKPVVVEYQGLDFKPSGLSGRDYSGGGKLKKGQKNFYVAHATKSKTIHRKKPTFKKVKMHTSKCAKW